MKETQPLGFHPARILPVDGLSVICYVENSRIDTRNANLLGELSSALRDVYRLHDATQSPLHYAVAFFWADQIQYPLYLDLYVYYGLDSWPTGACIHIFTCENGRVHSERKPHGEASTNTAEIIGKEAELLRILRYNLEAYIAADRSNIIPDALKAPKTPSARP